MKDTKELAKSIVLAIAESGFKFWSDSESRTLVNFDELSQTEQDRIFNEIEVTGIGLLVLYLDQAINRVILTEHQVFLSNLQKDAIVFYPDYLEELGVEKKFIKIWRKLIDTRLEEYRQDYQTALEQSSQWKEFAHDQNLRRLWAVIETLAIDSLHHIRRGKTTTDDPLWKLLRKWLRELLLKEIAPKKLI